jgi:hypothetical protein
MSDPNIDPRYLLEDASPGWYEVDDENFIWALGRTVRYWNGHVWTDRRKVRDERSYTAKERTAYVNPVRLVAEL